ncbi:MAG TPA: beta-glucanase [Candidatus Ligilactobacillus excrementavium]|nr:beta-glucanase [Candidatus Ligilactobacillus excrementavium]
MKRLKFVWIFIGLVALIYIGTLTDVRVKNSNNVQYKIYESWKQEYVIKQDKEQNFVNTSNDKVNPVALSEGQGYGLYITARAGAKDWAKQKDFDQLLNYYLAHRDYVGKNHDKKTWLMQWRQYKRQEKWVSEDNSAADGDLFIAYSLHQAAKAWPKQANYYQRLARNIEKDILAYEYNDKNHTLTVGDWVTKGSPYYNLMRTSDVAPEFFETFYKSSNDPRWLTVKNTMLDRMMDLSQAHKTGLVPDFAWVDPDNAAPVKKKVVASENDGDYSSNACRVPMMLATSDDPRAKKVLRKMMNFFHTQDPIVSGYSLSGQPVKQYQSNSFKAPIFYADNLSKKHHRLGQQEIFTKPLTQKNYYDATLTTIAAVDAVVGKAEK